jgi:hypothetical protein
MFNKFKKSHSHYISDRPHISSPSAYSAYSAWRFDTCTNVQKVHVLLSNCLCLATVATWNISGKQIYEDLGVLVFVDHIRALRVSFDWKLVDLRNLRCLKRKARAAGVGKPIAVTAGWPSCLNELCLALISRTAFGCSLWGFSMIFPHLQGKWQGT